MAKTVISTAMSQVTIHYNSEHIIIDNTFVYKHAHVI